MTRPSASNGEHPCQALRKDGRACSVRPLPGSAYCFAHDPEKARARDEGRRRGGQGKSRLARAERLVPATLRPVLTLLLEVLAEARDGTLPPAQANAVATVAGAIVKVYGSATVEQQIADLEAQIAALSKRTA